MTSHLLAFLLPAYCFIAKKSYLKALSLYVCLCLIIYSFGWIRLYDTPINVILVLALIMSIHLLNLRLFYSSKKEFRFDGVTFFYAVISSVAYIALTSGVLLISLLYSSQLMGYKIYHIPSKSMLPVLLPNDFIVVDTWLGDRSEIGKHDIIVFHHPYKKGMDYIKRVNYVNGDIFLGKVLTPNQIAVIGDNEDNSEDSRHFGAIDKSNIVGKAQWIIFSSFTNGSVNWERIGITLK